MSLATPKEIDDAFIAVFDDIAHYRSEMKRLDETMSDGWLNLVDADREGRSHATLNASAYAHRDDGVRARIRVQLSDDALTESADDFTLTPANAAASASGLKSGADVASPTAKPAYAGTLVNLEELAPSSPLWTDIKAAASAVSAPKAARVKNATSTASSSNNTAAEDSNDGDDDDDESEYDFADDPELDALIGASGDRSKDAAKLRDRRAPRPKPAATSSSSSSLSSSVGDSANSAPAAAAPSAPLFTSAEALQAWFAPLPLPSLNDAQRSFVAAITAALTVAGRKRRLEAILAQLERITAEPFALDDTAGPKAGSVGTGASKAGAVPAPAAVAAGPE
jgi:hypothetical protein